MLKKSLKLPILQSLSLNPAELAVFGSGKGFIHHSIQQLRKEFCKNGQKTVFITDERIWKNCRKFFEKDLAFIPSGYGNAARAAPHSRGEPRPYVYGTYGKDSDIFLMLKNPKADEKNLKKIAANLKNCGLIIGLGSGTINDLCKFSSAQQKIPYAIFASAASMNGYLSKNASITFSGHKKTLSATLPVKVFCDLEILKNAPLRLTKAGLGDSLCFYSCWFDWYLSHATLGTEFNEKPFQILQKKMNFLLKNYQKFSLKDEKFLKLLLEVLLLSGAGMTMAGGSYPASQSEHMIAHTFEMKYPKIAENNLHGEVVAIATLTSAKLQKDLLRSRFDTDLDKLKIEKFSANVEKFFGKKIALQCRQEYNNKISAVKNGKKLSSVAINKLKKIHLEPEKIKKILVNFQINHSFRSLKISKQQYQDCVRYAKFSRSRFTCLDFFNSL